MPDYIYDPSWEPERERLAALEAMLDPGTIRVFEEIGVRNTWRALEVGGGGGSITAWLAAHAGEVVVTDLDTRFVEQIGAPNLTVRTHDIVTGPPEEATFDLVHSRDVLEHIPERERALDNMVAALKPGGWVVVEDVDFAVDLYGSEHGFGGRGPARPLAARMWRSAREGMARMGIDPEYGRRLPERLVDRGLTDVDADVRARLIRGGTQGARLSELSMTQVGPRLVENGVLSEAELEELVGTFRDPDSFWFGPLHVAAWARKPA